MLLCQKTRLYIAFLPVLLYSGDSPCLHGDHFLLYSLLKGNLSTSFSEFSDHVHPFPPTTFHSCIQACFPHGAPSSSICPSSPHLSDSQTLSSACSSPLCPHLHPFSCFSLPRCSRIPFHPLLQMAHSPSCSCCQSLCLTLIHQPWELFLLSCSQTGPSFRSFQVMEKTWQRDP